MLQYVTGDLIKSDADIVVNASNGKGWMGGMITRVFRTPGIAEAINYATKGKVEKESRRVLNPAPLGSVFFTNGYGVGIIGIIHAVTMKNPGDRSKLETISMLLPEIIRLAEEKGAKSVAIPYLGCGTGKLKKDDVKKLYDDYFGKYDGEVDILIYSLK